MEALREVLKGCSSGPKLVAALEKAEVAGGEIPGLIASCINERVAGSTNGAAAAAGAERSSLQDALCVIDGLMFLSPRSEGAWEGSCKFAECSISLAAAAAAANAAAASRVDLTCSM